jgi:predicted nucleic acid-binding protein
MPTINGRYLIDTNVLIYATLADDPRSARARQIIERGREADCEAFVSVQNFAEMYPNLTGPKKQPPDSPAEARAKITQLAALPYLEVLPLTTSIMLRALELAEARGVRRQKFFDMQLAATLLVYNIPTLVTENVEDFADIAQLQVVNPFS